MWQWIGKKTHLRLVPDWRRAKKWFSMWAMAIATSLQVGWVGLPEDLRAAIPVGWVIAIAVVILVGGMLGRVIDQQPKATPDGQEGGEVGQ